MPAAWFQSCIIYCDIFIIFFDISRKAAALHCRRYAPCEVPMSQSSMLFKNAFLRRKTGFRCVAECPFLSFAVYANGPNFTKSRTPDIFRIPFFKGSAVQITHWWNCCFHWYISKKSSQQCLLPEKAVLPDTQYCRCRWSAWYAIFMCHMASVLIFVVSSGPDSECFAK